MPDGLLRLGLAGPIPEGMPGRRIAPHIECREFPGLYLTPPVRRIVRLWRMHADGHRLRDDGLMHWPAKLVESIQLLDRESKTRRAHVDRH